MGAAFAVLRGYNQWLFPAGKPSVSPHAAAVIEKRIT